MGKMLVNEIEYTGVRLPVTTSMLQDGAVTASKMDVSSVSSALVDVVGTTTGINQNYALKYADGTMICCIRKSLGTININEAWGTLYAKDVAASSIGNFAATFTAVPVCTITVTGGSMAVIQGTYGDATTTRPGGLTLSRPTSMSASIIVNVIAIGRWK